MIHLETDRLILRDYTDQDFEAYYNQDPDKISFTEIMTLGLFSP